MTELVLWCLCAWLGAGTPPHPRCSLCIPDVWAGPPAPFPAMLNPYAPGRLDPEVAARVAKRRADDARRAGRALDALCADYRQPLTEFERRCGVLPIVNARCPDCFQGFETRAEALDCSYTHDDGM